jgi:hypothetical protein
VQREPCKSRQTEQTATAKTNTHTHTHTRTRTVGAHLSLRCHHQCPLRRLPRWGTAAAAWKCEQAERQTTTIGRRNIFNRTHTTHAHTHTHTHTTHRYTHARTHACMHACVHAPLSRGNGDECDGVLVGRVVFGNEPRRLGVGRYPGWGALFGPRGALAGRDPGVARPRPEKLQSHSKKSEQQGSPDHGKERSEEAHLHVILLACFDHAHVRARLGVVC